MNVKLSQLSLGHMCEYRTTPPKMTAEHTTVAHTVTTQGHLAPEIHRHEPDHQRQP
jgi:hypothetical protein